MYCFHLRKEEHFKRSILSFSSCSRKRHFHQIRFCLSLLMKYMESCTGKGVGFMQKILTIEDDPMYMDLDEDKQKFLSVAKMGLTRKS